MVVSRAERGRGPRPPERLEALALALGACGERGEVEALEGGERARLERLPQQALALDAHAEDLELLEPGDLLRPRADERHLATEAGEQLGADRPGVLDRVRAGTDGGHHAFELGAVGTDLLEEFGHQPAERRVGLAVRAALDQPERREGTGEVV